MPTAHHKNPEILSWIEEFLAFDFSARYPARSYPRLFYIWGHSYEFDRDNNWELLDTICERLGGHEDIWYATNIEIYDYIKAYDSLVFSAKGDKVYNPTLKTVWFYADERVLSVKSGQTLVIEK